MYYGVIDRVRILRSGGNGAGRRAQFWRSRGALISLLSAASISLSGCLHSGVLSQSGPSTGNIVSAGKRAEKDGGVGVYVVDVDQRVALRIRDLQTSRPFSELFGSVSPVGLTVEAGDTLDVTIFEAPPAAMFGSATPGSGALSGGGAQTNFAAIVVDNRGDISLPFVGQVHVAGSNLQQIERMLVARLRGRAHSPQALVRLARNATSDVTIFGEVASSTRMPLTAKGERLLDALAAAGGVRQPVSKVTVQVARGRTVDRMPLDVVIADPEQNIVLQRGDIVSALYQNQTFTVFGATGKNEEIPFEAAGITLAQALARAGGLRDDRANADGVFVFRMESASTLNPALLGQAQLSPDGKVPMVYRINMRDAQGFFVAQQFPMRDHDILYVANAGTADVQKFLNLVGSALYPITALQSVGVIR